MIDYPIIDTHVHLIDPSRLRYRSFDRSYLLEDYDRACGIITVDKIVFIECDCHPEQYMGEVEMITELAKKDSRIAAIISSAPLEKGESVFPDLQKLAGNSLVKGIRRLIKFEDRDFCLQPKFMEGVRLLSSFGWTFDICTNQGQNLNAAVLVEKCRDVVFVLDHIGTPNIKDRQLEPWRTDIKRLSQFPNLFCKLSSLATEAHPNKWSKGDLKPYVEHIFDCFGVERLMYGGDWPVSSVAATLPVCVETLECFLEGFRDEDREKIFRENAIRVYRL